jgi:CSLREA domain-containing protein
VITLSKRLTSVLMIGSALFGGATGAVAASGGVAGAVTNTFAVNTTADTHDMHPGDGVCADSTSKCSLRAAIEEANAEPTGSTVIIEVPATSYLLTLGTLSLTRNTVSIAGAGVVILKVKGTFQLMRIGSGVHANISGVTMEKGKAGSGSGGGLGNSGTTTLAAVTITSSKAAQGGAVYNAKGASLTLDGVTVSNSKAAPASHNSHPGGSGGGIFNAGSLTLSQSTVSGNFAGQGGFGSTNPGGTGGNGGGIDNTGTVTVIGSTISGNEAGTGGLGSENNESSGNGGDGGGLYSPAGSSVSLTDSLVQNNVSGYGGPLGEAPFPTAGDGGGIWSGGTLSVTGTTFTSDTGGSANGGSGNGGGIFTSGTTTVDSSTFAGNSGGAGTGSVGGSGGAIDNAGTLRLADSTLSNNGGGVGGGSSNGGRGGGLYSTAGSVTMSGDTLNGNTGGNGGNSIPVDPGCSAPGFGGDGGAIYSAATLSVTNSTLSGNTDGQGGFHVAPCGGQAPNGVGAGIAAEGGTATVSYSTIADNTDGIDNVSGTVTVGGSILADSTLANCAGAIGETTGHHNLDSGNTCAFNNGTDISGTEPLLGSPADNGGPTQTQSLEAGSPAIDAGGTSSDGCPATDQRGDPRPDETSDNGACDIGAYESQSVG